MAWVKAILAGVFVGLLGVMIWQIVNPPGARSFINQSATLYPALKPVLEEHPALYTEVADRLDLAFDRQGSEAMAGEALLLLDEINPSILLTIALTAEDAAFDRFAKADLRLRRDLEKAREFDLCARDDLLLPAEPGRWSAMDPAVATYVGGVLSDLVLAGTQTARAEAPDYDDRRMAAATRALARRAESRLNNEDRVIRAAQPGDEALVGLGMEDAGRACHRAVAMAEEISRLTMADRAAYSRWRLENLQGIIARHWVEGDYFLPAD